jgi:hypothetical protein
MLMGDFDGSIKRTLILNLLRPHELEDAGRIIQLSKIYVPGSPLT